MDSKLSIPLLTPSIGYVDQELKMISFLKRQDLYEVSIGIGKQSYDNENDWINESDGAFGEIGLALSPSLRYLTKFVEYPKDLWTKLDRTIGKHNEDHNSTLDITSSTAIFLYSILILYSL